MKSPMHQQVEGNWNQVKGKVKEAWGVLTDDDVDQEEGQIDHLVGRIQEKTGETREAIREKIDAISQQIQSSV